MAYQTGDTILDDHYNGFVNDNTPNNLNKIWGTGNGNYGYGQSNTISTVSAGSTVTASQWNTVLDKMQSIKNHQGSTITSTSGGLIAGDPIAAILSISTDITTLGNNRGNVAPGNITQTSNPNTVNRTFTGSWTTSTIQEVSFTFASGDAMRYFFNAGGKITHVWNLSGGTADAKYNDWVNTLNVQAATFTFAGFDDSLSGAGTPTVDAGAGFWNGSITNGGAYVVVQKQFSVHAGGYYNGINYVQWEVKVAGTAGSNGGKGTVLTIKSSCVDAAADEVSPDAPPGSPTDPAVTALDIVDGTLTSSWSYYKPNTTYLNNDAVGTITAAEVSQSQS